MSPETEAELLLSIGRIDANVSTLVTGQTDHEKRIKSLEGSRSRLLGAASLVSALVAVAFEWLRGSHG